ncbi:hypothetical protein A2U01_0116238, partial [Trifolium medium]|nr:hypothetical protein [Trifolium medium]
MRTLVSGSAPGAGRRPIADCRIRFCLLRR